MKIAITGAKGYVGRHIAKSLSKNHEVVGLTRSLNLVTESMPETEWRVGDLNNQEYLANAIADADLVIHCAMSYTSDGSEDIELDKQVINTILKEQKRVIYTSSLFGVKEDSALIKEEILPADRYWRFEQEKRILEAGGEIIRLGFVYGGDGGYFWEIVKPDENKTLYFSGKREYIWPMIHVNDLADLYKEVAECGVNEIYHGWDGVQTRYFDLFSQISYLTGCELKNGMSGYAARFMKSSFEVANENAPKLGWSPVEGNVLSNLDGLIPLEAKVNVSKNIA